MSKPTYILGISAYYHDSAAALLADGEIVAAGQEERFTRVKGDASFPTNAVQFCLKRAGITVDELDYVGFYDKPLLKFERILETYLSIAPGGFGSFLKAGPLWIKEKLFQKEDIAEALGWDGEIMFAEHHESHAASAFIPSPFDEAAILTMDGVGEWATASIGVGRGNDLELLRELARLARTRLLGLHVLHRLQGQLRRVQGHGPRAVRRAEVPRSHPERADGPQG